MRQHSLTCRKRLSARPGPLAVPARTPFSGPKTTTTTKTTKTV